MDTLFFVGGGVIFFLILMGVILAVRQSAVGSSASGKSDDICARYQAQAAENPKNPEILLKWGHVLAVRAGESKATLRRMQLYKEAAERFRKATELAPSLVTAWKALGQTLYFLFRLDNCEDRAVQANANAAYEAAVRLKPAEAALWQHWGEDLYMAAAYCKEDEKREKLVSLAKARYARAVALQPELMEEWRTWGGNEAALEEVREVEEEARKWQEGRFVGSGGETIDEPSASGESGQPGGAMPWELGADTKLETIGAKLCIFS